MHSGYYDPFVRRHEESLLKMNEVLADCVGILPTDRVLDTPSISAFLLQVPWALGLFPKERLENIKAGICHNKSLRQGYASM
jgi:hypothetical protein